MIRRLLSRRLLWALALSLLVHFMLVTGADFSLPDWSLSDQAIKVTLAPPPPRIQAKPASLPAPEKPSKPAARPRPQAGPVEPVRHEETPPASPELVPVAANEPPAQEPVPAAQQAAEEPPVAVAEEEAVAVPAAPKRVEIDFQILRGKGGTSVGKVKQVFKLEGENRYVLHSVAEATGLVSLFVSGKFEEQSEGLVTGRGLLPDSYRQQRGNGKVQVASFNWEVHRVSLEAGDRVNVVDMPDGTQDMLSLVYQFMFVPPLDEMRVTVANGKRLRTYAYAFEGEQEVETRMGKLRTLHIAKPGSDGEERTELWLALDYRHLPVKIRQTDKDGTVTEQLAIRLLME
jgi:hypothetical protein